MATEEEISEVRVLIPDTDPDNPMFSDEELGVFIDRNEGDLYLAAADALDVIVSKMVFSGAADAVRTDDLSIVGSKSLQYLTDRAAALRDASAQAINDDFQIVYPFGSKNAFPEGVQGLWGVDWQWGRVPRW